MLYLIYKKVCEYDREGNATDHRRTHDRRQRAEEAEKKRLKEAQNATKRIKHPPDPIPAQNDWSNNIYYKQ